MRNYADKKDHLAVSDGSKAEVLRQEAERLKQEIEESTEFSPESAFDTQSERERSRPLS